jgi:hypothetical protein
MAVELAMDLYQRLADVAHEPDAGRLIVDKSPAATVGANNATQHQAIAACVKPRFTEYAACRMIAVEREFGRCHCLCGAGAHHAAFGTKAKRQSQSVKENRFARAGLTRQYTEAWSEIEVEPVDQNQVAYGEAEQHARMIEGACVLSQKSKDQKMSVTSPNQPELAVAVDVPVTRE